MTLLVTVFAAVISTAIWYKNSEKNDMCVGALCFMYWGASIMWLVDAIFEYAELKAEYFNPAPADMLNDLFLGFSAVAFGLVVWVIILVVKDPRGVIKAKLSKSK